MNEIRPRRNRKNKSIRKLVQETILLPSDFVLPVFIVDGQGINESITTLPGQYRYSIDQLLIKAKIAYEAGICGLALFPKIDEALKDSMATEATNDNGLIPKAIKALKEILPDLLIFTDVAMDPYSIDGHDGIVKDGKILNDESLEVLGKMALCQARAGADFVSPSDMMDGRVGYIRKMLDKEGFTDVGILSYSAKYASSFYGPFRDALSSAPKEGDKKTYQMNPSNAKEALREIELDEREGADIVMIKPALNYLDIIAKAREKTSLPIAAYMVSGEYSMIKFAAQAGCLNEKEAMWESHMAIKRAGADFILSYAALELFS